MSGTERLGLIVRSAPWCGRSGRDQLDLALTAATLGIQLDLFFIGQGVLHLLGDGQPGEAGLPDIHRAWRALGELTTVTAWGEEGRLAHGVALDTGLFTGLRFVPAADMPALQSACDRLLVL